MNSAIILLSGGLDSLVSLAVIKEHYNKVLALTFNYGQKSFISEINASEHISDYYNIEHKVVNLDWLKVISGSALTSDKNIPEPEVSRLDDEIVTLKTAQAVWVPNRNGLFVNIAACYAEALNYNVIVIGANKEEGATFKDNTPSFVETVNEAFKNSVNSDIKLIAPLINMDKKEIVKEGLKHNAPFSLLHSCYKNETKHCGKCESCLRLKRALELNNRYDIITEIFE